MERAIYDDVPDAVGFTRFAPSLFLGYAGGSMQDEAIITINGVKLSDAESMTVRVAVDTLANVLAEGLEEKEAQELTTVYMDSLVRIQGLIESREARKQ
jgi:hypothetical protein